MNNTQTPIGDSMPQPTPVIPQYGWICPKCGRVISPFNAVCPYCSGYYGDQKITC